MKKKDFTSKELIQMVTAFSKDYVELTKWLQKNHPTVWKDYRKTFLNNKDIMFLEKGLK